MYKSSPFFSIIIPTYNSEATLSVALDSVRSQTYQNLEVLIMDGKSEDKTLKIAESYKKVFPRIRIYSEKDKGIYDAMNKGINLAKGSWLYFMGSDDNFYEKDTLEKISFNTSGNLVVYGSVYSPRFNGIYDGAFTLSKLTKKNICHQSIFFHKNLFRITGKFNLKYPAHADWDHNLKWFFSSKVKSKYVNQVVANYADGGYSSINGDEIFKKDKFFKIVKLGFRKLTLSELLSQSNQAITNFKRDQNYFNLFIVILLKSCFKILRKVKVLKTK